MKEQNWRSALQQADLDILPTNSSAPSSLKSFQRRFFGCKARGIMLRCHSAAAIAVGALGGGENALGETRRAREHFANSRYFDNVYADGNDHK